MNQSKKIGYFLMFLALFVSAVSIKAEVPHLINYQGRLTDNSGNVVADGNYSLVFKIWDAAVDGNEIWSETHPDVTVAGGIFSVILGSMTPPLPDSAFFRSDRWLGITLDGEEILPRTRLLSVPYAYMAQILQLAPTLDPGECNENSKGRLYYDESKNEPCYCNGTLWLQLDGGGPCLYACVDYDGDGYDNCDPSDPKDLDGLPMDCDDNNANIHPNGTEFCFDGLDNDCDGFTDCEDYDCTGHDEICGDGYDNDCDGYTDCEDYDCISPEVCTDGIDNDCDGYIDCEDYDCTCLTPGVGILIITEIMANPASLPDTEGEWFEIINGSGYNVDLYGVVISTSTNSFQIDQHVVIGSLDYATIANSANPGFTPDVIWANMALSNSGSTIRLDYESTMIDQVTYISTTSGASLELSVNHLSPIENDNMSNWCTSSSTTYGSGDYGTPGAVNNCSN